MKLSLRRVPDSGDAGAGVPVAWRWTQRPSNGDGSNLLEELRGPILLHRLRSSERAPSGYDLLKIATRAARVGPEDIGA